MTDMRFLHPPGWPDPSGYANGVIATGATGAAGASVFVGGQIGWDAQGVFAEGIALQVGQALRNIVAVLHEAGAAPTAIVRLTWFVCDVDDYIRERPAIGRAYRAVLGKHFPAMSVVGVTRLVEPRALVEIEATAVL